MTTLYAEENNSSDPFLTCKNPPASIIDANGEYRPGWYKHYHYAPNITESAAPKRRLQYWFHIHCESQTHYFSANIAQLGLVGNVSLLIIDKHNGNIIHSSQKKWLWANRIQQTGGCAVIWDPNSGSTVSQNERGVIEFSFHTTEGSWSGRAKPDIGPPFVQSTPASKGFGSLQWWGPIRILSANVSTEQIQLNIPEGVLGGFDRTIGHRLRRQHWNWLCTQGRAIDNRQRQHEFAIQMAVDNLRPKNSIHPKKLNLWIHNRLHKFERIQFIKGNSWTITAQGDRAAEDLDLCFTPTWHRREKNGHPAIFGGHFQQLFGPIRGTIKVNGQYYKIDEPFALVEDSKLSL